MYGIIFKEGESNMNKEKIIEIIKKYLANKYNCDINDLEKTGLNIIKTNNENRLKMLLFYDLVLVSASENLYDVAKERLTGKNVYEIFELPLVYGQSIYFIPDLKRLEKQEEISEYEFRMFDGNTNEINVNSGVTPLSAAYISSAALNVPTLVCFAVFRIASSSE